MSELLDGLEQDLEELDAFHRCLLKAGTGKPDGPFLLDALMRRARRYLDQGEAIEAERQELNREEREEIMRQLSGHPGSSSGSCAWPLPVVVGVGGTAGRGRAGRPGYAGGPRPSPRVTSRKLTSAAGSLHSQAIFSTSFCRSPGVPWV
jgi:hypothetical protein